MAESTLCQVDNHCTMQSAPGYTGKAPEVHHDREHLHQPVLLRAAVSVVKDSHPRPASKRAFGSSTQKKICWKNWAGTICVRVDQAAAFKNCCMRAGSFDGERRNYFFQRVDAANAAGGRDAVRSSLWQIHRNASSLDTGLAHHDFGI